MKETKDAYKGAKAKALFGELKEIGAQFYEEVQLPPELTLKNLKKYEKASIDFIKWSKRTKEPLYSLTVLRTGILLGETIAQQCQATWITEAEEIWDYRLNVLAKDGSEFQVFPFIRSIRFFEECEVYGLVSYVEGIKALLKKELVNL